eukprot:1157888-Pelagomonas_calceolata.AAC.8
MNSVKQACGKGLGRAGLAEGMNNWEGGHACFKAAQGCGLNSKTGVVVKVKEEADAQLVKPHWELESATQSRIGG